MPDLLDAFALFQEHAFENALPIPDVIDTARRSNITIQVRQFDQFLGLYDDGGNPLDTTVWGYMAGNLGGYPGPVPLASSFVNIARDLDGNGVADAATTSAIWAFLKVWSSSGG